ncbi:conserved domain protein [Eggerthella sp. CAG:1427]|nr:conserved domain protein [Eggerthella sp. CAG:1427]
MNTLKEILTEKIQWRKQILNLGLFDLRKQSRGAVLGSLWFFAKPAVYIFVFWFALEIGLKVGSSSGDAPYILWLIAGLIPWFYMQDMINTGSDVYHRYSYLVNKIKFPLSGIPTIYNLSTLVIQIGLIAVLLVVYFLCGMGIDLYLIQLPIAVILMVIFFDMFALMTSLLSAISKDFKNLIKTLSTPLFWLSGIIFDVFALGINWITTILMFNPVTFFASMYRAAVYDKIWIWEKPEAVFGFLVVFVITLVCTLVVYSRTREEVPDVL